MSKIGEKIIAKLKSIGNAEFLDDKSQNPVSVPFWELSFLPIGIIVYRFKQFLKIASVYAVLIGVLALISQLSYTCGLNYDEEKTFFNCEYSPVVYLTFFLLRLFITAVFLRAWYHIAVCGAEFDLKALFTVKAGDWKVFGGMIVAIIFLCLPMISMYILLYRVPNPDWRIESVFFAFASSGFWLPFVGLRFASVFAFALSEEKRPNLSVFWQRTTGNTLKIIVSLTLMVILNAIIFMYFDVLASYVIALGVLGELLIEWIYGILFLLMASSFASLTIIQKEALFSWYSSEE